MVDENNYTLENAEDVQGTADPLERLLDMVVGKEDALEKLFTLVKALDDKGFFKTTGYFVDEFDELVDAGVDLVATPQFLSLLSAGSHLKDAAKELDLTGLPSVTKAMNGFMQGMAKPDPGLEVRGAFDLIKLLKDPDIRVALTAIFSGLKSFGKGIRTSL